MEATFVAESTEQTIALGERLGRLLAAHEEDASQVQHLAGPDHMRIHQPRDQNRIFVDECQDVAHQVRTEGAVELLILLISPKQYIGVGDFYNIRDCHTFPP